MYHSDVVTRNRVRIKKLLGDRSYLSPCDLTFDLKTGEIDLGLLGGRLIRRVSVTYDNQLRGSIHFKERSRIFDEETQRQQELKIVDLVKSSLEGFVLTELPNWYSHYLDYIKMNPKFFRAFKNCATSSRRKYFEQIIPRYILKHGRTWASTQPRNFFVRLIEDTDAAKLSRIINELDLCPEKRKHFRAVQYSKSLISKLKLRAAEEYNDPGLFRDNGFVMGLFIDRTTFMWTKGDAHVLDGTDFVVSDTSESIPIYDMQIHLFAPSFYAVNELTNQSLFDQNMKWTQAGKEQILSAISHEIMHAMEQFREIPNILGKREGYTTRT